MTKIPPHYSPSVRAGNMIITSGQLPILNRETKEGPESIEDQTRLVLKKLDNIMKEYGVTKEQIVKTTAYITDMTYWPAVNSIYAEFFGDHKPARTVVPVTSLNFGCKIEVDAVAIIGE
ncbi:MAG: 2-iminobutanoate/2-iminopropanoate deaminase [Saprospiraceae bacterium]|jgi:2-iminobutanoate/2-iminopropanoate deaminase